MNLNRRLNEFDVWPGFENLLHYDAVLVLKGDVDMLGQFADKFANYTKHLVKTKSEIGKIENIYSVFLCYDFKGMERLIPVRCN